MDLIFKRENRNFKKLLDKVNLNSEVYCLDIFSREGDWQSFELIKNFKNFEAWDINKKSLEVLKKNYPNVKVKCKDSIEYINSNKKELTNLLVIDNSLNCYGQNQEFCEHFDFIENIGNILFDESYVIFNVCIKPFNLNKFKNWEKRRNNFYNINDSSNLDIDFLDNFYVKLFNRKNLIVLNKYILVKEYVNNIDYLYYFMFKLKKNDSYDTST